MAGLLTVLMLHDVGSLSLYESCGVLSSFSGDVLESGGDELLGFLHVSIAPHEVAMDAVQPTATISKFVVLLGEAFRKSMVASVMVSAAMMLSTGVSSLLPDSTVESVVEMSHHVIEGMSSFPSVLLPWEELVGLFDKAMPSPPLKVFVTPFNCSGTGLEGNFVALVFMLLKVSETRLDTCLAYLLNLFSSGVDLLVVPSVVMPVAVVSMDMFAFTVVSFLVDSSVESVHEGSLHHSETRSGFLMVLLPGEEGFRMTSKAAPSIVP